MMCASADGTVLPPFTIYQGSHPTDASSSAPPGWVFKSTKCGWINTNLFQEWFEEVFLATCMKDRPVMLVMDNHISHLSTGTINLAIKHDVTILCLPPHSSHVLQPLDKGYFNLLKKTMGEMAISLGYGGIKTVPCRSFAKLLQFAMAKIASESVRSAFRATGLYPFKRIALENDIETVDVIPSSAISTTDETDLPCSQCGKVQANKLVKLGIIPPYLGEILLPPPSQRSKKSSRAKLPARVLSRVAETTATVNSIPAAITKPPIPTEVHPVNQTPTVHVHDSVKPGPSRQGQNPSKNIDYHDEEDDDDDDDDETCCVCHRLCPPRQKHLSYLKIVKWAQCAKCLHWTHLEFCTNVKTVDCYLLKCNLAHAWLEEVEYNCT